MNFLNIITKLYQNENFMKYFLIALALFILLIIIVFILGKKDYHRSLKPKEEKNDFEDISFEMPKEYNTVKEDVTFEMPILTQSLDEFRKSIEQEITIDNEANNPKIYVKRKKNNDKQQGIILDRQAIEETFINHQYEPQSQISFQANEEQKPLEVEHQNSN